MESDPTNKEDISHEEDISYEEEQLQQLLIQESEKQKIAMDRELREAQEKEYQECVEKDTVDKDTYEALKSFDEPSLEEMRKIRLDRFETKLKG